MELIIIYQERAGFGEGKYGTCMFHRTCDRIPVTIKINVTQIVADGCGIKDTLRHELVHYIRRKKRKWSAMNYGRNILANFIEEAAAYRVESGSLWRGMMFSLEGLL